MFFRITFYLSLVIFTVGLIYKITTWFSREIEINPGGAKHNGRNDTRVNPWRKVPHVLKGIFSILFSRKVFILVKVFLADILFQNRILKESFVRWVMHMCIFVGFMLLLILHALDKVTVSALFRDYASTLNPYLFLRNLGFLLVAAGLAVAVWRRFVLKTPRFFTNGMDRYALVILAVILFSGLFLEATKIVSHSSFQRMVADYGDPGDPEALKALETYWAQEFGVVSPSLKPPFDGNTLEAGREIHEMNCAACHSRPQWAAASYGLAKVLGPVALTLDRARAVDIFWAIHILASFFGLAYLPFSKMFHILASPLSLLANAVMGPDSDPVNIGVRQMMELDACTHCGTCTLRCSVGVSYERFDNVNILPSEKLAALKALAEGKPFGGKALGQLRDGLYLCTNCLRCTGVCPVGINLQDLWFNARETLLRKGASELLVLSPFSLYRGLKREEIDRKNYEGAVQAVWKTISVACPNHDGGPIEPAVLDRRVKRKLTLSPYAKTYAYCFTCTTCTSACPVVRNYDNPPEALGLVPHQIVRAVNMGLSDPIFSSGMLWNCLGCYKCQDSCPQGVRIADLFYALKNLAFEKIRKEAEKAS